MTSRPVPRAGQQMRSPWALVVCLAGLAASVGVMMTGHWRKGSMGFALVVLVAGLLRLLLPERLAGLLAVRAKWLDCLILLSLGALMAALVMVVPPSPPS